MLRVNLVSEKWWAVPTLQNYHATAAGAVGELVSYCFAHQVQKMMSLSTVYAGGCYDTRPIRTKQTEHHELKLLS